MACNRSVNIFLLGLASGMKTDMRTSPPEHEVFMTFAYAFSVTAMVAVGLISNIISIDVFRRAQFRSTSIGLYLLIYSCCSIFGLCMLESRLFQLLDSLTYIPFFIICNVVSGLASIFTRICLWMNGIIAFQRSLYSFEHNQFLNKIRSRSVSLMVIPLVILMVFIMHIHELICRVTLPDPVSPGKFVCQITYSPPLLILNTSFTFLHLFTPFVLHILATCLIMASICNRKATLHQTTYLAQWLKEFRAHGHLFLAPMLAVVCTLPQIILPLKFSCVDVTLKWLLRTNTAANLLLYIPQASTFFLFVLPSDAYLKVCRTESIIYRIICRCGRRPIRAQNIVLPMSTTAPSRSRGQKLKSSRIPEKN